MAGRAANYIDKMKFADRPDRVLDPHPARIRAGVSHGGLAGTLKLIAAKASLVVEFWYGRPPPDAELTRRYRKAS
jgi:hypothetical protein